MTYVETVGSELFPANLLNLRSMEGDVHNALDLIGNAVMAYRAEDLPLMRYQLILAGERLDMAIKKTQELLK